MRARKYSAKALDYIIGERYSIWDAFFIFLILAMITRDKYWIAAAILFVSALANTALKFVHDWLAKEPKPHNWIFRKLVASPSIMGGAFLKFKCADCGKEKTTAISDEQAQAFRELEE